MSKQVQIVDTRKGIRLRKMDGIRVVFVQPQFDTNAASKIASVINGVIVPLDPLNRNYIKNMEEVADNIHQALQSLKASFL